MDTATSTFAPLNTGAWPNCSAQTTGRLGGINDTTRVQGRKLRSEDSEFGRSALILFCFNTHRGFLCGFDLVDGPPQAALTTVANDDVFPFLWYFPTVRAVSWVEDRQPHRSFLRICNECHPFALQKNS